MMTESELAKRVTRIVESVPRNEKGGIIYDEFYQIVLGELRDMNIGDRGKEIVERCVKILKERAEEHEPLEGKPDGVVWTAGYLHGLASAIREYCLKG